MRNYLSGIVAWTIVVSGSIATLCAQPCIDFLAPVPGGVLTTPVCTLLIEEENCTRRIKKLEFQASYFPPNSDTATVISIGSVTRPPFTMIWDISQIPNQLFSGASFFAEATLSNGELHSVRRDGIFFLHQKVDRPVYELPFDFSGTRSTSVEPLRLPPPRPEVNIESAIYWNKKEVVFNVKVVDPHFDIQVSREKLASMGAEILIDPTKSRKPFPGKEVYIYSVPLNGKSYRILYKTVAGDSGVFKFETSTVPCDFNAKITKASKLGFTISFPLPMETFGSTMPESIGCNLVVKTLSEGKIVRSTWVKAGVYNTYAPFLWGELRLLPRPVYMNRLLVGALTFIVGFFIALLIVALIMKFSKRQGVTKVAAESEADRQQFASIKENFDTQVIASDVTLDSVAKTFSMQPRALSMLIRRATGMDFQTYVMYARIEIVKERLRSSHCSEESLAQVCGFESRVEMEKYFMKFHHTTPAKFRSEQQVV